MSIAASLGIWFDRASSSLDIICGMILIVGVMGLICVSFALLYDCYAFCRGRKQPSDYYIAYDIYTNNIGHDLYDVYKELCNHFSCSFLAIMTGLICMLLGKCRDAPFYWCRRSVIVREKIDG